MATKVALLLLPIVIGHGQFSAPSPAAYRSLREELGVAEAKSPTDLRGFPELLQRSRVSEVICRIKDLEVVAQSTPTTILTLEGTGSPTVTRKTSVINDRMCGYAAGRVAEPVRMLLQRVSSKTEGETVVRIISIVAEEDYRRSAPTSGTVGKSASSKPVRNTNKVGRLGLAIQATRILADRREDARVYYTLKEYESVVVIGPEKDGWRSVLLQNGFLGYVRSNAITVLGQSIKIPQEQKPLAVTASSLCASFESNEIAAKDKYGERVLLLTGTVLRVAEAYDGTPFVVLKGTRGLACEVSFDASWREDLKKMKVGRSVRVKARYSERGLFSLKLDGHSVE